MNPKQCQKYRENYQSRPHLKYYHVSLHILTNLLLVMAGIIFVARKFGSDLSWSVPLILCSIFIWGLLEYSIHRFLMHQKISKHNMAYKEHTLSHHFYYVEQWNSTSSQKDFVRIFFQPLDVFLINLANAGIGFLMYSFIGKNIGLHFFLVGSFYYLIYEFFHFVYHTNDRSFFQKIPVMKNLIRHHRIHHNQSHMNHGNFSLLFPVFDKIFGTYIGIGKKKE